MFFSGIADEAGKDINMQIKAHKELGWSFIEMRNVGDKNFIDRDSTVDRLEKAHVIGERGKLPATLMKRSDKQPKYEALCVLISSPLP